MIVNVTGFRRRKRLAELRAAEKATQAAQDATPTQEATNEQEPKENGTGETLGTKNDELNETPTSYTVEEIDAMDIEQVRAALTSLDVPFVHNTGVEKLKAKLKEVCGYVE